MRARWARPAGLLSLLLAVGSAPRAWVQSGTPSAQRQLAGEIRDPQTGQRWLMLRDPAHPRWPARLVPAEAADAPTGAVALHALPQPVIHGGDAILIEETTPVLEAHYDAVALSAAERGKTMKARLKVNGRVVNAVALGPGRAALAVNSGGRR